MVKQLNTICLFGYFVTLSTAEVMKLPMKYAMIRVDELSDGQKSMTYFKIQSWYFTEQTEEIHEISEYRQLVPVQNN
jgi:hypothetical protein